MIPKEQRDAVLDGMDNPTQKEQLAAAYEAEESAAAAVAEAREAKNAADAAAREATDSVRSVLPGWDAARRNVRDLERSFGATPVSEADQVITPENGADVDD